MRIMGIDYGKKRIGVAISNEEGDMAFPQIVIENVAESISEVVNLAKEKNIDHIVIGASIGSGGIENEIMGSIEQFGKKLIEKGFEITYESEFFSSVEATRFQGHNKFTDASAAAIILQRYLDKHKNNL